MPWSARGKRSFYYTSRRIGGRVVNTYLGRGPLAQMAAAEVERRRRDRAAARARLAAADADLADLADLVAAAELLAKAALLAAGYHRHSRGRWRRRRGRDAVEAGAGR
jgi:hypothetical protein